MCLPTKRFCYFVLSCLSMVAALMMERPELGIALDHLPRSSRVGSLQIPLASYERIPLAKLLSSATSYHLHEIRIAGIVHTVRTQIMTRGCGKPYEFTVISLEDESGVVDVLDQGACGRNTSPVRATMLASGEHVDLLVQIIVETGEPGGSPEVVALWIEQTGD